jgi:hypothetical protein
MHPTQQASAQQQKRVKKQAVNTDSYAFFNLLTGAEFVDLVEMLLPEHRERLFPPTETLSMFLAQAMSADRSCQNAVNNAAINRLMGGLSTCSTNTGAYCQARKRLPLDMVSTLARYTGQMVTQQAQETWNWHGRPVKLVDGTTCSLPDTKANQASYPQPDSQEEGLGFPMCRLVGLTCLSTGAVIDLSTGTYQGKESGELSLLRLLAHNLDEGDILLGDALYATYFQICDLMKRGVDCVFEQNGARRRNTDFRRGEKLGVRDHIIELEKPKKKPDWMSLEEYELAPARLKVRELHTGGKILVTTLLCPKQTNKSKLGKLYKKRWHVELDFRDIKTTLGMETLSCKTPKMAEKEIWVYILAYNIIRLLMAEAAMFADTLPRLLSFSHTKQLWLVWASYGTNHCDAKLEGLFVLIGQQQVGKRPGRIEPRAIKRRPKSYAKLTKSRSELRAKIQKQGHPKKLK